MDTTTNTKYSFYGNENVHALTPINPKYKHIDSVFKLYDILSNIWCRDTCAPRMRHNWTESNKTLGQCSITSFLVQDIFGGTVYGIPLGDGNYHCYNIINNIKFDLTSEQFESKKLIYAAENIQERSVHFSKAEKHERYLYLLNALTAYTSSS